MLEALTALIEAADGREDAASSPDGFQDFARSEPDFQGMLRRRVPRSRYRLQRPAQYDGQEFFTGRTRSRNWISPRSAIPGNETRSVRRTEQDVADAWYFLLYVADGLYGISSHVADCESAGWANSSGHTRFVHQTRAYIREWGLAITRDAAIGHVLRGFCTVATAGSTPGSRHRGDLLPISTTGNFRSPKLLACLQRTAGR